MKLETRDGRLFSVRVERYEFPDEDLRPTDDNPADEFEIGRFLVVAVTFRNAGGEWSASGSIMTTEELGRLAEWMDSVATGEARSAGVCFTERDLEFSIDHDGRNLHVHAFRDFLPDWCASEQGLTIELPIDQIDLKAAVDSLRSELKRFPGRPPPAAV